MARTAADWDQVRQLFDAALALGPEARAAMLDRACAGNLSLREEIESLLIWDARPTSFIESSAVEVAPALFDESRGVFAPGTRVGAYEIVREIGRGGMSVVCLGRRADGAYDQEVAIKLIKRGGDTGEIVHRFRNERQILASLHHPNIARVIDGGTTAEGLPYFVMEYVNGLSITAYCKERRLATSDRLRLFRTVCSAVQFAHQHLVIHRDLKPSNILVTSEGVAKLLDFGIAKLVNTGEQEAVQTLTLPATRFFTPEYASPEQISGVPVTTATDVYSLGVVLYELLTGQKPYGDCNRTAGEWARAIAEREPTKPSTAVLHTVADGHAPCGSANGLRGDLDNILLKALRKESDRRYGSVEQFSEDIRRHLEGRPVLARKGTLSYRTTKFVRRNKLALAAAGLFLMTLITGLIATAYQAKRAAREAHIAAAERDRARVETVKADRISSFLQNVLGYSDPSWISANPERKRDATISEALADAARRAQFELANQPEVLAAVQFTIGHSYRAQGRLELAEPLLRSALATRKKVLGQGHQSTAQSMVGLAELLIAQGKYQEALELQQGAILVYRRAEAAGEADLKWFAISLNDCGLVYWHVGKPDSGEALLREALEVSRDFAGAERAPRAVMLSNLALIHEDQGNLTQARLDLEASIAEHQRLPGEPRFEMAHALSGLARVLVIQSDYDRAERLSRQALDLYSKTLGKQNSFNAFPLLNLSRIYYQRHDYESAMNHASAALDIQTQALPESHPDFARTWGMLGLILMRTGDLTGSEGYLRRTLDTAHRLLPTTHPSVAAAQGGLGECLTLQNRYDEAESLLVESYTTLKTRFGESDPRTIEGRQRVAQLYTSWGKKELASHYQ